VRLLHLIGFIGIAALGLAHAEAQEDDKLQDLAHPALRLPLNPDAVLDSLENRAHDALARILHPQTQRDVEALRPTLRKSLERSLGYNLLPWPPDLRSTITGIVPRAGAVPQEYRIEKLLFQTIPDVIATAHLYIPEGRTSAGPAILLVSGHASLEGKLQNDSQIFSIAMARLGFVVFTMDSIGAGERKADRNIHHPDALLVGLSEAGIDEYEIRCALEYLRSRKEVDDTRIGITGASGAGLMTWLAGALEERVAAVAPVDATFPFEDEIHRMRAVDWNGAEAQSDLVPGILQYANIHELLAMTAPRNLMIVDGFRARGVYEYGKGLYGSFGDNARIRHYENEDPGFSRPRRQAMYGFFLAALRGQGDGSPVDEPPAEPSRADSPDLQCLPNTVQISAGPGISSAVRRLAAAAAAAAPTEPIESFIGTAPVGARLGWAINPNPVTRANIIVEKGVALPVTILRPGSVGGYSHTLITLDDRDKESLASDPIVQEALRRDHMVWEIDPRGFGELPVRQPAWAFATSLLLGENFVWRQAWDLRILTDALCNINPHRLIAVYARGPNSSLAAAYLVKMLETTCPENLDRVVLRGGYSSLRQFLNYPAVMKDSIPAQSIPYVNLAFDALRGPDLPQLLSASRARTFIIDPLDPQSASAQQSDRLRVTTLEEFLAKGWE
jgi:hypothetical protein